MKVLYFSRDYTTHDRNFLSGMAEHGVEAHYLRLESDGTLYERRPPPDGVRIVDWEGGRARVGDVEGLERLLPAFERVLREVAPDVVHAGPIPSCGWMAARVGARPLLLQSWGSDILRDAELDADVGRRARLALERSDMLFCDCDAVRLKVQGWMSYPPERIVQFPWGTDPQRFSPGADVLGLRSAPGWGEALVALSTRSWEPVYGIETLLEGLRAALDAGAEVRLVLVGDGTLAPRIQEKVARLGLGQCVHMPGRIPHERLGDYFRAVDVFVGGSLSDGSSISLLEAMSCALPVVVTDIPGNREWVEPGRGGFLYPAGDAGAFARALCSAAEGRSALADMGRYNRRVVQARADWGRNFGRLVDAYKRMGAR